MPEADASQLVAFLLTRENFAIFFALIFMGYLLKAVDKIPNSVIPLALLVLGPWAKVAVSGRPIAWNLVIGVIIAGVAHLAHGAVIKHIVGLIGSRIGGDADSGDAGFKPPVKLSLAVLLLIPCLLMQGCSWFGTSASESGSSTSGTTSTTSTAILNGVTYYGAMAAGGASADLVINNANKSNKLSTAKCVVAVSDPLYSACTGKTITAEQMATIVDSFKISEDTTVLQPVIAQVIPDFITFINEKLIGAGMDETTIKNLESGYVYGWQFVGQVCVTKYSSTDTAFRFRNGKVLWIPGEMRLASLYRE